jgi:hypothetical protein
MTNWVALLHKEDPIPCSYVKHELWCKDSYPSWDIWHEWTAVLDEQTEQITPLPIQNAAQGEQSSSTHCININGI